MTLKQNETKVKSIAPLVGQLIKRDLGKYGGNSGVNKLFFLTNVIDLCLAHLNYEFVVREFLKEMERLEAVEKETGVRMIHNRLKSWDNCIKILNNLRPILAEVQMRYDDIKDKEMKGKTETAKKIEYRKLTSKVSPYQPEIYWLFNFLIRLSDIQRTTIPTEAFRTPETSKYVKQPFTKEKKPAGQPLGEGESL